MNVFKNRQNTQKWNPSGDREYEEITLREVDRVAPQWVEEPSFITNRSFLVSPVIDNRWGFNSAFTMEELERALQSCRDRSSPGWRRL